MLNKQKGNMYQFVTHTWNPIRGKCPHDCSYCYMKKFKVGELRLEEKELETNLGEGNYIFVGSSTDMWAEKVPSEWIHRVLYHCMTYPKNTYLFQTKNPKRYSDLLSVIPRQAILGTTIETNKDYKFSKSPKVYDRCIQMAILRDRYRLMVSIEPIMDFDLKTLVYWIVGINPEFVSIGADSQGHNLPEPSSEKIKKLIEELQKFTKVRAKDNLKRLL